MMSTRHRQRDIITHHMRLYVYSPTAQRAVHALPVAHWALGSCALRKALRYNFVVHPSVPIFFMHVFTAKLFATG